MLASAHGLEAEWADAATERGTELARLGRWSEARGAWLEVMERAHRKQALGAEAVAGLNLTDLLIRTGEWAEVGEILERLDEICRQCDFPHISVGATLNRALLSWHRGSFEEAAKLATQASNDARAAGVGHVERAARAASVMLRMAIDGDAASVSAEIDRIEALEPIRHAAGSDDGEFVAVARSRWLRGTRGKDQAIGALERAAARAREPYASAMIAAEIASLLATTDPERSAAHRKGAETILASIGARLPPEPVPRE